MPKIMGAGYVSGSFIWFALATTPHLHTDFFVGMVWLIVGSIIMLAGK